MGRQVMRTRQVPSRTIGSGTRPLEMFPLSRTSYLAGLAVVGFVRRWRLLLALLALAWLAGGTGSLTLGMLLAAVVYAGAWCAVVAWARRGSDASYGDAVRGVLRMRRLRARWDGACVAASLADADGRGPRLRRLRLTTGGDVTAVVVLRQAWRTVDDAQRAAPRIAELLGCRGMRVRSVDPGVAECEFRWADPLTRTLRLRDLPAPAAPGSLVYGVTADGVPATINPRLSLLVVGSTGSGKSTVTWNLLASAAAERVPIRLRVADPAGGVELNALEARVGEGAAAGETFQVAEYAHGWKDIAAMIGHQHRAMGARLAAMKARGERLHVATVEEPYDVLVVDEMLAVSRNLDKDAVRQLEELTFLGRKAGFAVWGLAQLGQKAAVAGLDNWRDLVPQRVLLRVPTRELTDSVLGPGAFGRGADAPGIRQPGRGFGVVDGSDDPVAFRAAWVTDTETESIAAGRPPGGMRRSSVVAEQVGPETTALYRWYDEAGSLLYVGISNNPLRRADEHAESKPWWHEVSTSRVERFSSREEAEAAEAEAIRAERPRYNIAHAGAGARARAALRVVQGGRE